MVINCLVYQYSFVMPGLVPGIHEFLYTDDMDGRDKPGHDGVW
jgi:hypothetical protein